MPCPGFGVSKPGRIEIESERLPFAASAVVAEKQNERVFQFAGAPQRLDQSPDVGVHVFDHRRVDGHPPSEIGAALSIERVPEGGVSAVGRDRT